MEQNPQPYREGSGDEESSYQPAGDLSEAMQKVLSGFNELLDEESQERVREPIAREAIRSAISVSQINGGSSTPNRWLTLP